MALPAETLLDEYAQTKCGACLKTIVPYTIGRVSYCPICRYTWNVTCIRENVKEMPELREFHRLVILDELREKRDLAARIADAISQEVKT